MVESRMRKTFLVTVTAGFLFLPLNLAAQPTGRTNRQNLSAEPSVMTNCQRHPSDPIVRTTGPSLFDSALREAARVVPEKRSFAQDTGQHRSWISRHPALFGTLIGAGMGALASATMENELFCSGGDEDCLFHGGSRVLVGAGMGAGAGAAIGFLVGLGK